MIVFIKLIFAHLIGDFLLQFPSWVEEKEKYKLRSPKLYIHIVIHGLLVLLFLGSFDYWLLAFLLAVFHGIIDVLKLYAQNDKSKTAWFLVDQGLHLISIVVLWILFFKPNLNYLTWFENDSLWIYATAILFITLVTGIIIQILMSKWSKALGDNDDNSLMEAGRYIGILERLFVFLFVIMGRWEGIGFLLAAKSVFRFGDLKGTKDRKLTEYILIGTLLSFGMAIATGLIVLRLIEKN